MSEERARDDDGAAAGARVPVDAELLGRLLEEHLPALRAYVGRRADRLVLSRESRSDIVQSVCREVVESSRRYEHRSVESFRHWLFHTAERKVIDRYRYWTAARRDAGRELHAASVATDAPGGEPSPSQDAAAAEAGRRLVRALDGLPDHYREVVTLARLQGLPLREVAERMGKSEDAVRNLLFRAIGRLSDVLAVERGAGHGEGGSG